MTVCLTWRVRTTSRKPTLERGSQDGGLSFTVENAVEAGGDLRAGPTLTMRRISKGQEIRKVISHEDTLTSCCLDASLFLFVEQPVDENNYEFPDLIENHLFVMRCDAMLAGQPRVRNAWRSIVGR